MSPEQHLQYLTGKIQLSAFQQPNQTRSKVCCHSMRDSDLVAEVWHRVGGDHVDAQYFISPNSHKCCILNTERDELMLSCHTIVDETVMEIAVKE